jgi:hypothetical protein
MVIACILVSSLTYSSILKVEIARSSETSVDFCKVKTLVRLKDNILHNHRCEILRKVEKTFANPVTFNLNRNMKNKEFCSHFRPYSKRHVGFGS